MRKWYLLCVMLLGVALCSTAFAKPYNYQKKTADQRVERLTTLLSLTTDQQVKIKDLIIRRDKVMAPLFDKLGKTTDKEEQREIKMQILENHQKFREEMNEVLTTEQEEKYRQFLKKRIQQRKMGLQKESG